jgi:hypothetical protein
VLATGVLDMKLQLESDSVAFGLQGKIEAVGWAPTERGEPPDMES